jgi:hypothetical protein
LCNALRRAPFHARVDEQELEAGQLLALAQRFNPLAGCVRRYSAFSEKKKI